MKLSAHMRSEYYSRSLIFSSVMAAAKVKTKATAKRKRVVLSISNKLEVLYLLDKSVSYTVILEEFTSCMCLHY